MFPSYKNHVSVQKGKPITVDGVYTAQTKAWVQEFQKRVGLKTSGEVDKDTREKLYKFKWKTADKRTNIRVGTLNIPLDSAKLPNGSQRVHLAAKQINDSDLAVVAVQELDRGKTARDHKYAEDLLGALGKGWKVVKPTTSYNENYIFYRPAVINFKSQQSDIILPSSKGGRHATRAEFSKGGTEIRIFSTHFVSGKTAGRAREEQGKQLSSYLNANSIVMGDLNQKNFPAALERTHKTVRDQNVDSTTKKWGTYVKWGKKSASKSSGAFLDHIGVPDKALVRGYNLVGVDGATGVLTQPRVSDHFLVIASIDI
jgi:endonuclease/exonuclease/phosphatase family metal-dependent hydrolase